MMENRSGSGRSIVPVRYLLLILHNKGLKLLHPRENSSAVATGERNVLRILRPFHGKRKPRLFLRLHRSRRLPRKPMVSPNLHERSTVPASTAIASQTAGLFPRVVQPHLPRNNDEIYSL